MSHNFDLQLMDIFCFFYSFTAQNKTVFARLGSSEPCKPIKPTNEKPKQVFSRLGSKDRDQIVPIEKDALKYEGILKSDSKKIFTVTSVNNVRKIAVGTMRADQAPISVKEKLSLKTKSVKFSNQVQYKEIEPKSLKSVNLVKKFTPVFNKPERRLSMPDNQTPNVKTRLGMKSEQKLTLNKNVFNRLGA